MTLLLNEIKFINKEKYNELVRNGKIGTHSSYCSPDDRYVACVCQSEFRNHCDSFEWENIL